MTMTTTMNGNNYRGGGGGGGSNRTPEDDRNLTPCGNRYGNNRGWAKYEQVPGNAHPRHADTDSNAQDGDQHQQRPMNDNQSIHDLGSGAHEFENPGYLADRNSNAFDNINAGGKCDNGGDGGRNNENIPNDNSNQYQQQQQKQPPQQHSYHCHHPSLHNSNRIKTQFRVLYTHQKTKKKKLWKDGRLALAGTRGSLHEACPKRGQSSAALAIDTLEFTDQEARDLVAMAKPDSNGRVSISSDESLESEKYLIMLEDVWRANTAADGAAGEGDGDPLWNTRRLPQFGGGPTAASHWPRSNLVEQKAARARAGMNKLLNNKFKLNVPRKTPPMRPEERRRRREESQWIKRPRPLQPGEWEKQHYGSRGGGGYDKGEGFGQGTGEQNGKRHIRQNGGYGGGGQVGRDYGCNYLRDDGSGNQGHPMGGIDGSQNAYYHQNDGEVQHQRGRDFRNCHERGPNHHGAPPSGAPGQSSNHNPPSHVYPNNGRNPGVAGAHCNAPLGIEYHLSARDDGHQRGRLDGPVPFQSGNEFVGEDPGDYYGEEESDDEEGGKYDGRDAACGAEGSDHGRQFQGDNRLAHQMKVRQDRSTNNLDNYRNDDYDKGGKNYGHVALSQRQQQTVKLNGSNIANGMSTTTLEASHDHPPHVNIMDGQVQEDSPKRTRPFPPASPSDDGEDELLALLDTVPVKKPQLMAPATSAHAFNGHISNSNNAKHNISHENTNKDNDHRTKKDSNAFSGGVLQAEEPLNNHSFPGGNGVLSSFSNDVEVGWGDNGFVDDDNDGEKTEGEGEGEGEGEEDVGDFEKTDSSDNEKKGGAENPQKEGQVKQAEEVTRHASAFTLPSASESSSEESESEEED